MQQDLLLDGWTPPCVLRGRSGVILENPPSWLMEEPDSLGFPPLIAAFATRFLLPAALSAGVVVGGGLLLKDELGINPDMIPWSAALGAAGTLAFVFSGDVGETLKPVLILAGIIGTAGSVALLFYKGGEAARLAPAPARDVPAGESPATFNDVDIVFDVQQPQTGGTVRAASCDQEFEVSLRNVSGKTISFFMGLTAHWAGAQQAFIWRTPAEPGTAGKIDYLCNWTGTFGRQLVTLAPGEGKNLRVAMPSMRSLGWWGAIPEEYTVQIELFRSARSTDLQAFHRSGVAGFVYSVLGFG